LTKKNPPETANACPKLHPYFAFLEVLFQSNIAVMGAVRGTPVLFWFLGFRCWVIGGRKREEYSRWKGMAIIKAERVAHGVFFG